MGCSMTRQELAAHRALAHRRCQDALAHAQRIRSPRTTVQHLEPADIVLVSLATGDRRSRWTQSPAIVLRIAPSGRLELRPIVRCRTRQVSAHGSITTDQPANSTILLAQQQKRDFEDRRWSS